MNQREEYAKWHFEQTPEMQEKINMILRNLVRLGISFEKAAIMTMEILRKKEWPPKWLGW